MTVLLASFSSFFRGVFYPCLRRTSSTYVNNYGCMCRAEKIGNVFVGIVTCVSCIVVVVRVHVLVAAVFCLAW